MAHPWEDSSITPSTPAFLALLAEQKSYKKRCEMLTLENQCILRLSAEANELRRKLGERKKADAASKTTPKGQMIRGSANDKRVAALEKEFASVNASHSQLDDMATRSEADASRIRTDIRDVQARLVETAQEVMLGREDLD